MKTTSLTLLSVAIVCACSSNHQEIPVGVEVIPVEVHEGIRDASSIIEKIEIVPLETNDSSIFHKQDKVIYDKETDYVYLWITRYKTEYGSTFIYNRRKREGFLLKGEDPLFIPPCSGLIDNVLYQLFPPIPDISRIVDLKLMSPEEIRKMEALHEEDNPVIVKYYLKK